MRKVFMGLICLLFLGLCGCTAAQVDQFNSTLKRSSERYQQSTYQMMNNAQKQLPSNSPNLGYGNNKPGTYLINTKQGIKRVTCVKMNDGSVYCY